MDSIGKEIDMRKPERIKPFLLELAKIWEEVPDWRFTQLIINILGTSTIDPWFMEEEDTLKLFKEYFKEEKDERK